MSAMCCAGASCSSAHAIAADEHFTRKAVAVIEALDDQGKAAVIAAVTRHFSIDTLVLAHMKPLEKRSGKRQRPLPAGPPSSRRTIARAAPLAVGEIVTIDASVKRYAIVSYSPIDRTYKLKTEARPGGELVEDVPGTYPRTKAWIVVPQAPPPPPQVPPPPPQVPPPPPPPPPQQRATQASRSQRAAPLAVGEIVTIDASVKRYAIVSYSPIDRTYKLKTEARPGGELVEDVPGTYPRTKAWIVVPQAPPAAAVLAAAAAAAPPPPSCVICTDELRYRVHTMVCCGQRLHSECLRTWVHVSKESELARRSAGSPNPEGRGCPLCGSKLPRGLQRQLDMAARKAAGASSSAI